MQGVEAVERILSGRAEITATDPDFANSKKHPWPFEVWNCHRPVAAVSE